MQRISVEDGRLTLPDGMSYRVLVLPKMETMTPTLLEKIKSLVHAGATIVGNPPSKSPSLADYPQCDARVRWLAAELWGEERSATNGPERHFRQGRVIADTSAPESGIYPSYNCVVKVLANMGVPPDFEADQPLRYVHRREGETDIYFVANGMENAIQAECVFHVDGKQPELWDPVTGEIRLAKAFTQKDRRTTVPLSFNAGESLFVIFRVSTQTKQATGSNTPIGKVVQHLHGPWSVTFDPKWGGPRQQVWLEHLVDWTKSGDEGIRHYSGIAVYRKSFESPMTSGDGRFYLALGRIKGLADVALNGKHLGVVWCDPWRIEVTNALRTGRNELEIAVANLWTNRLIGDTSLPKERRFTQTTWNPYGPTSPLLASGLLGPVEIVYEILNLKQKEMTR